MERVNVNSKVTVSGNIISELSDKIPSNIIALNELLKNSYDAGAPKVTVILDTGKGILEVIDNGSGMDAEDVDTLFHISKSTKKYGKINEYNRYTQGAKGLGFLSVFKFGKHVEWKTKKENGIGLSFRVDYDAIVSSDNISLFDIDVKEIGDTVEKGTTIIISLDEYNKKSLKDYFLIEKNYQKILYAFDDPNFTIELHVNGTKYVNSNRFLLKSHVPEHQLYYVLYKSEEQKIKYFYNNCELHTEDYLFNSEEYKVDIELNIYHFPPYGKDKVDKLFINHKDDITPLIYVNSNLFNNYELFDPNIMRNIKTQSVLSQMIGYIRIISDSDMINFNSDRSKFLQNELTDSIISFLSEINKAIQTIGSEKKKYLIKKNQIALNFLTLEEKLPSECNDITDCEEFRRYIKSDFTFKSKVAIEREKNVVKYKLFGKEDELHIKPKILQTNTGTTSGTDIGAGTGSTNTKDTGSGASSGSGKETTTTDGKSESKIVPAAINFNTSGVRLPIPTEQINLRDFIASIYNSNGNSVSKDLVTIKNDGVEIFGGILPSVIDPIEKTIEYSYSDSRTGLVLKTLKIEFYRSNSKITGKSKVEMLISLPSKENYQISYNHSVTKLIKQINSLDLKEYLEVIACSLRSGFEMSIDSINKSNKFGTLFTGIKQFEDRVVKVITYINNQQFKTAISNSTKIDYLSLGNILDAQRFRSGISTAHLGAHKAGTYVAEGDVIQLAKLLGIFVVMTNEMLQNNNIN
jgi:hypothetical protein